MSGFRIVIAGEEEALCRRLRRLISLEHDCELAGEFTKGAEAVAALGRLRADIVFLDVPVPEAGDCDVVLDVVRAIRQAGALVILTSARALGADAFDCLVKPFGRQRFRESLRRAKSQIQSGRAPDQQALPLPERIAVRNSNGSIVFVRLEDIDWIGAADNYAILHRGKEQHVVRATMNDLQARLDAGRFLRIHRSTIVNLEMIRELRPWFRGDYLVVLRDGTELTLTKSHRASLASRLLLGAA